MNKILAKNKKAYFDYEIIDSWEAGIELKGHEVKSVRLSQVNLKGSIIHSDQGFHYTHPSYQTLLNKKGVIQSMSRKGNCLDNSPTESFFGHLKDDIDLSDCKTLKDVENVIKNYIIYYNNNRFQWNKKKMTPVQYRNHLLTK